jgi:hypothetical protein
MDAFRVGRGRPLLGGGRGIEAEAARNLAFGPQIAHAWAVSGNRANPARGRQERQARLLPIGPPRWRVAAVPRDGPPLDFCKSRRVPVHGSGPRPAMDASINNELPAGHCERATKGSRPAAARARVKRGGAPGPMRKAAQRLPPPHFRPAFEQAVPRAPKRELNCISPGPEGQWTISPQ